MARCLLAARAYRPYKRSAAKPAVAKRKATLRTAPPSGDLVTAWPISLQARAAFIRVDSDPAAGLNTEQDAA